MKHKIAIVLWLTFLFGCALQRDVVSLDDRLEQAEQRYVNAEQKSRDLESKLAEYRKTRSENDKDLRSQTAGQYAILDSLREEVQILSGKLEETEYSLKQQVKALNELSEKRELKLGQIDKISGSNKDRIARLEQYLNFETTASHPTTQPDSGITSKKPAETKLTKDGIYQAAKHAFDQGDFEAAKKGFQKLITKYPKSKNADNAQFWIGEIYYHQKWFEKAILEYQKVIENYPKGNKVQASLLKQGFAFFNIGDKANARLILSDLIKRYPSSNEAKIAKQKLKGLKP
jgi:tol-pal system protein YbgF